MAEKGPGSVPGIAVVIPNRNDATYLGKCLDSVLGQDSPADEIIVVDDQSDDASVALAQARLAGIPGASVLVNPRCLGTMGALNVGLAAAKSDYVLFLSSNDYLQNGIFARARAGIGAAGNPGVWSAMVWVVDEQGRHLYLYPSPVVTLAETYLPPQRCIRLAQSLGHWFTGTTLVYHRETLQALGGFDTAYRGMGDMIAALTVASLKGAVFAPEPLGVMRQHEGGTMWRTLTDLPGLDAIVKRMQRQGPRQSPSLFSPSYLAAMRARIRFTAIRTSPDGAWRTHPGWRGRRHCWLSRLWAACPGKRLRLALAFLLLRPPADALAILRYRYLGRLWVLSRLERRAAE